MYYSCEVPNATLNRVEHALAADSMDPRGSIRFFGTKVESEPRKTEKG